jgi:hypothetical protein
MQKTTKNNTSANRMLLKQWPVCKGQTKYLYSSTEQGWDEGTRTTAASETLGNVNGKQYNYFNNARKGRTRH